MVRCCLIPTRKCNRLSFRDQSGFSLLEIMVAVAIMTTVGAFSTNLMTTGADHVRHVYQKAALSEMRREVLLANQDNPTCTFNLSVATDASLVFDSTAASTTLYVNRLRSGPTLTSSIVAEVDGAIGDSGLTVDKIRLTDLANNGSGIWTGIWKITFKPRTTDGFVHRELTLSPQAFQLDRTVPAAAKIVGCTALNVAPIEWLPTGNSPVPAVTNYFNYYFGTTTNVDIVFRRNGNLNGLINSIGRRTQWGVDTILEMAAAMDATAFGYGALFANTTGIDNTALGDFALTSNTTGQRNTAVGSKALRANVTGENDTAVGASALASNTTGSFNTAVGVDALLNNTSGWDNTAFGVRSLMNNTVGNYNTSFGNDSLMMNVSGTRSTAVGYKALENANANLNTAVGNYSLQANSTGATNLAIGHAALGANTTANNNVAIGTPGTLAANTTGEYNTALGSRSLSANTSGSRNTALGHGALTSMQTGSFNTAVGKDALALEVTGDYNTAIGYRACSACNGGYSNSTSIGSNAQVDRSNMIRLGDGAVTIIAGAVLYVNTSDERLKEDIAEYPHGLDLILKLRPVKYNLISHDKQILHSGFIAQEVEGTSIPFYGVNRPANDKGFYSLDYSQFVVPLVNAVKEVHLAITDLRHKLLIPQKLSVEKLKQLVASRRQQLADLKADREKEDCRDQ